MPFSSYIVEWGAQPVVKPTSRALAAGTLEGRRRMRHDFYDTAVAVIVVP
jgi:hypothetical protein